jgi:hypothetical protein
MSTSESSVTDRPDWDREKPAFPLDLENIHPPRDEPNWTESFHGSGYDPENEVGLFVHAARAQFDPELWDETLVVYLPDGRFLACRDFGYGDDPSGPSANALLYQHREPFERWEMRWRGGARLVTADELGSSALTDDEYVGVDLSLDMQAVGPVCGIGGIDDEFWAHVHTEQHLALKGEIKWDGQSIPFNGTGLRDHSVGARDVSVLDQHTWCHGEFPSGRLFMAMDVDAGDGTSLRYAVVGDADGLREATIEQPTTSFLSTPDNAGDSYTMELTGPDGPAVIEAEILRSMPLSLRGTNSWVLGTRSDAHHLMYECQTRFEWDGEVGHGLTERSVKL